MQKNINFKLSELSNGAVQEKIDKEMRVVLQNVLDPNTDFKKARKVIVEITFNANEARNTVNTDVIVKSKLVALNSVSTTVLVDRDVNTGQIMAAELQSGVPGQTYLDTDEGELKSDIGEPIAEENNEVIDFNKRKSSN